MRGFPGGGVELRVRLESLPYRSIAHEPRVVPWRQDDVARHQPGAAARGRRFAEVGDVAGLHVQDAEPSAREKPNAASIRPEGQL